MSDHDGYQRYAPHADDLWLKLAAWKQGTPVRQVRARPSRFNSIPVRGGHLSDRNLTQGGNDRVLSELANTFGFTPGNLVQSAAHQATAAHHLTQSSR